MSTTYISAIVSILVMVLPRFGITVGTEEATNIIQAIVVALSGIWIIYRRYQQGDVTPLGLRK